MNKISLLLLGFLSFFLNFIGIGQTTVTFTTSGSWTVPSCVTSITVTVIGGGGGGGGTASRQTNSGEEACSEGGGGGGGGAATRTYTVTPGEVYNFTVGAAGAGGIGNSGSAAAGNGLNGGTSTFSGPATIPFGTLTATGGTGGGGARVYNNGNGYHIGDNGAGGAGGIGSNGSGNYTGGNGSMGNHSASNRDGSGAGGGGAGSTANGSNATAPANPAVQGIGGNGGNLYGGKGGDGRLNNITNRDIQNGTNGAIYGAGGGGGAIHLNTWPGSWQTSTGGSGATGIVIITYTIPSSPTATASSNSPVCIGQTLSLSGGATGGTSPYSYSWSGPNGFTSTSQNPSISSVTAAAAGTYTLTVTDAGGCTDDVQTIVVVNTSPTINPTSNSPICSGQTLNLSAGGSATTYSWTGPNGFTSSVQNPSISNATTAATGTYTLLASNGTCSTTLTTNVTVNPSPTATASSNSPVCVGDPINFTSSGGGTYSWTGPSGFTSSIQNPTISSAVSANAGTYILTVTAANGCISTANVSVTVNPKPTPTIGSNSPVCTGSTINLTSGGGGILGSYSWTGPNGYTSTQQNPSITNATASNAGTYTVTVTNLAGCSAQATVNVSITSLPDPSASSNSPVCEGETINLSGTGGSSYSWSGPDGFTSTLQNPSITSVTSDNAGIYTVNVTQNGCSKSTTVNVVVNTKPTVTISGNSPCVGDAINLTATGGGTYSWSGPNGFTSTQQNPTITNATGANAGSYQVTVTGSNGCTATANVTVTVNTAPTASASSPKPTLCAGETINLSSSGGTSYNWTGPNSFTSTQQNPVISNATTAMSGTYTVTVSNGSCSSQESVVITVNSLPDPGATVHTAPFCVGGTINLGGTGGGTYSWSGPNGFTSTQQNPVISNATTSMSGTYTVTVTGSNGCKADAQVSVTVNSLPTITAGVNSPICVGQSINLTATAGGTSYSWTGPNSYSSTSQNPTILNATSSMSGTYTVTMTASTGCSNSSNISVTVNDNPTATANSNSPVCEGEDINLTATGGGTYSWTGPNSYTSTLQNPTIGSSTSANAGSYIVTVTNGAGCTAQASVNVSINAKPSINTNATPSTICSGNSSVISVSGPAGTSYSWNNGVGSGASHSVSPSITTIYDVTATGLNGCQSLAQVTVNVNPSPSYSSTPTNPTCGASNGQIVLVPNGGTPGYTYSIDNGLTTQGTGTFTGLGAATYNVLITDALGCTAVGTISLSNLGAPTINNITPSNPNCNGSCDGSISIAASGGTGVLNYQWFDQGGNPIGVNSNSISGLCAGSYSVQVTDQNSCTVSTSASLSNPAAVNASFTLTDFCAGESNNASNIATPGGTFSFDPAVSDGATINASTGAISNGVGGTTYTVKYTTPGACPNSSTQQVTVSTPADAGTISGLTTLCPSGTATYTSNGDTGGSWGTSDPLIATIDASGNLSASSTGTINVTYTVTGTGGCPDDVATYSIAIGDDEAPVFNSCISDTTLFSNDPATCDIVVPDFTSSTQLDIVDNCGNITSGTITVSQNPVAGTVLGSGTHVVTITALDNSGNSSTCNFNLVVADTLSPVFNGGCINDTTLFSTTASCDIIVPDFTTSSQLNITDNCSDIASGTLVVTQQPAAGTQLGVGTHTIVITATDNNGNSSNCSFVLTIADTIKPIVNVVPASGIFCEGEPAVWQETISDNCAIQTVTSTHQSGDILPVGTTTVTYTVTDVNGNVTTYSFNVIVDELPTINFVGNKDTVIVCSGLGTILSIENPDSSYTYTWYHGTTQVGIGSSYVIETALATNAGKYTVVASNSNDCTDQKEIVLIVEVCEIVIPEIFTPNKDGLNDVFYIGGLDAYPNSKVWIYNRWGTEVYQNDNYLNDWDGSSISKLNVGGDNLPEGTYYYILQLGGEEGQPNSGEIYKGYVYLKR
ncbi:MAG: gliding motility-associated C-terminal domain-containing protein [Crocinitomicaceae bacterium]|nr:gliding motility-associated C-terminal domain-containing protein [Crocinitomicaceae bacterium]